MESAFNVLLRRAALIVKGHHQLGRQAEIGDDEPDTGEQLAGVPNHLGHDGVSLAVVVGSGVVFFLAAAFGYDPQRGAIRRAPRPA